MSVKTGLVAHLLADAGVAALVGVRVYHENFPQNPTYPALTYQQLDDVRDGSLDGPTTLVQSRIQVDCWARSSSEAQALADAVRVSVNGLTGDMGGQPVQRVYMDSQQDLGQQMGDWVLRRVSLDLLVIYTET